MATPRLLVPGTKNPFTRSLLPAQTFAYIRSVSLIALLLTQTLVCIIRKVKNFQAFSQQLSTVVQTAKSLSIES